MSLPHREKLVGQPDTAQLRDMPPPDSKIRRAEMATATTGGLLGSAHESVVHP